MASKAKFKLGENRNAADCACPETLNAHTSGISVQRKKVRQCGRIHQSAKNRDCWIAISLHFARSIKNKPLAIFYCTIFFLPLAKNQLSALRCTSNRNKGKSVDFTPPCFVRIRCILGTKCRSRLEEHFSSPGALVAAVQKKAFGVQKMRRLER